MTSETADKDAPPAADEVVGDSESSSQNTEASVKTSQGSEPKEDKQEDAETAPAPSDDVEMKPAEEAEAEDKEVNAAAQVKESKSEDEPGADEAGDVETKEAPAQEAKSEDDAPAETAEKAEETTEPSAVDSNGTASEKQDEDAVTDAKEKPAEAADAKASEKTKDEEKEASELKEASSPKRKEPQQAETSNGLATPTEPATKKQKVDGADTKASKQAAGDATTTTADGATPSVMISRDDMAKMEEDSGRLKFEVIKNDGTDEHMIQLTTLKNIFAKQLPKMPKEYIVRLVFDHNHRSMLILKNGTHVIGGICYRPFEKNHFAEIAFCAINASDQVKGYGTRLMNHLKEYVKIKNITHFLTYADNYAIGYFKKQGFTKSVSMARPNWYGYIKDYDGGTLMECTIHTQINYLRITSMIHMQRKRPSVRLLICVLVGDFRTRDQGSLKSQLSQLLKHVSNHRSAWPFHEPVDTTVVVDYLDHIKEPIDLQLISKRIDNGAYLSKAALKADLEKMCDNCTTYNTPDTNYYKYVLTIKRLFKSMSTHYNIVIFQSRCRSSRVHSESDSDQRSQLVKTLLYMTVAELYSPRSKPEEMLSCTIRLLSRKAHGHDQFHCTD
ncbi:unnamed protein product [Phytophthora lilii]|uniref:histone acetyltransferase n=1 Tax=Phytophthora lilii TaxID=2077276 RepID=A0A9W6TKW4_9STRA|nr:unnamed protein product [Phytophthora lilii]